MLTQDRLKELLDYDPITGIFTWKVKRNGRNGGVRPGDVAGKPHNKGYWIIGVDGKCYIASRLAWLFMTGLWPENNIDHENLDKTDNRWLNLRECNQSQNGANSPGKGATSGYKGVSKFRKKWVARIMVNRKNIHLGVFDDPEIAHEIYVRAAKKYFGDFARAELIGKIS